MALFTDFDHMHNKIRLACVLSFQDAGRVPVIAVLERSMLRS